MSDGVRKVSAALRLGNRLFEGMVDETWAAEATPVEGCAALSTRDGKKVQSDDIELTEVSTTLQDEMVEAMLFGEAVTKIVPLGNKHQAVFKIYDVNEVMRLSELPKDFVPPAKALSSWDRHWDMVRTLAGGLESYMGIELPTKPDEKDPTKSIKDIEKSEARVRNFKEPVLNYLFNEWTLWKSDLQRALKPGVVGGVIKKS